MHLRLKVNLLLLTAVIGVALIILVTPDSQENEGPTLLPLTAEPLTTIRIERPDQPMIELQRKDHHWQVTQPIDTKADPHQIEQLLRIPAAPVLVDYPLTQADWHQYGLAPAAMVVTFNDQAVQFGTLDPIYQHRYVRVSNRLHLIDDYFYYLVIIAATNITEKAAE